MMGVAAIQRHRTAMVRHTLSQPMSLMVQHGLIHPGISVFDYGCGQGDDLRTLTTAGVKASGWDPHFAPDEPRSAAEIVNLGFVLNVIEDPQERRHAIVEAWRLTRTALAVSTMIAGQVPTDGLRRLGDGFLTSRGTFQKYFVHSELRTFVADATGTDPVAVAPGIFLAFRRPEDEEEYLLRRRMGRRTSTAAYRTVRVRSALVRRPQIEERIAPALASLADLCRMRGRPPAAEEVPQHTLTQLAAERVSLPRALDIVNQSVLGVGELEKAAAAMREDLLVHYALARLNRSKTMDRPSPAMIRDVRAHFGSQRDAHSAATGYLMALADENAVTAAFEKAVRDANAALDHRGRLLIAATNLEALPGTLRVYLGCAAYLAGEPEAHALVRIDRDSRTVSYMPIDDWREPFPCTTGVTVIDLKRQKIRGSTTRRTLLARSLVLGSGTRAQKKAELTARLSRGIPEGVLMVKIPS